MIRVSFFQKIRYRFDNLMSKGSFAPIMLLVITCIVIILLLSVLLYIGNLLPKNANILGLDNENYNFINALWITILRMLDGGVISEDPIETGFLAVMFLATVSGIVMISMLIAIVNSGVTQKIINLRKGKSFVVEQNHTVILGWSFQVFPIISELVIANENQKNQCIAILAEKDKVEMEDEIKSKVPDTKTTRIVCRTGNPIDLHDLEIINPHEARSIIIIAPDIKDPDSIVIKTILAITNNPHRKPVPHKYHIVAEIRDPRNVPIAQIAGKDEVQLVVFDYLVSRITAQTCRQPGLSVVFTELLDFSGDEIYFQEEPRLVNKTFVEAMFAYETSTVIGLRKNNGDIVLKPPMNTIIEKGDMVIAIAEDDDKIILSNIKEFHIDHSAIRPAPKYIQPKPEATLIIGWNRRTPIIINELDKYVWPGSTITIISDNPEIEQKLFEECPNIVNHKINFKIGDPTNRKTLDEVKVTRYDHVIVLSQTELTDVQSSDARTLSTLLHLRDIADSTGHTFSIVSEMLDDRNRELAEITHADDFIVSVRLDSLMLSQISQNKELRIVFETLFSAGGPAIYIKPAEYYVELGRPVNFYTVLESARQQNHIAIGYKLAKAKKRYEGDGPLAYGVVVNPPKSHQVFFNEGDKIIILADENHIHNN